jgi:Putative zinc-finger
VICWHRDSAGLEQPLVVREGSEAMLVKCEEVWREVSNYLDGEVSSELRAAIEEHVRGCKRCTAVVDGTRNVIQLYADERMVEVPLGFSRRLHQRLEGDMPGSRRSFFGWMVATAAALLVAGGFEVARSAVFTRPRLRSEHARASSHVPPDMIVIVAEDGKTFHVTGCPFIHDKARLRTISARDAEQEGYAPCVRCMKKYLDTTARVKDDQDLDDVAGSADTSLK